MNAQEANARAAKGRVIVAAEQLENTLNMIADLADAGESSLVLWRLFPETITNLKGLGYTVAVVPKGDEDAVTVSW